MTVLSRGKPLARQSRADSIDFSIRVSLAERDWLDEIATRRGRSRATVLRAILAVAANHKEEIEACLP